MIQSLQLRNYQSHKSSLLDFDPGVNVIVGQSDSGKTSILRALRKLTWNRPTGDAMRSNWGGTTHITVKTDRDEITWMKNNTESSYQLNKTHFKAVGTDVPAEIQQALNINEINLQQQLDQPFLLTSSPGEVAAHFNKVAKLNKIDEGLKNVNSWIREIGRKIDANKLSLTTAETQLKGYGHLEKFDAKVEVLEEMDKTLTMLSKNRYNLTVLIDDIGNLLEVIDIASEILSDKDLVNSTLDLIYKRDGLEDGPLDTINSLIEEIKEIDANLEDYTTLVKLEVQVNTLFDQEYELQEKEQRLQGLYTLAGNMNKVDSEILTYQNKLEHAEREFEKAFPDICPLCNKPK